MENQDAVSAESVEDLIEDIVVYSVELVCSRVQVANLGCCGRLAHACDIFGEAVVFRVQPSQRCSVQQCQSLAVLFVHLIEPMSRHCDKSVHFRYTNYLWPVEG